MSLCYRRKSIALQRRRMYLQLEVDLSPGYSPSLTGFARNKRVLLKYRTVA